MTSLLTTRFVAAGLLLAASLPEISCSGAPGDAAETVNSALASVSAENHRRHMEALASDAMEGREAGTAAYERAARYVAGRYEAFGLEPIGDDGTFFQQIEFLETRLVPGSARFSVAGPGGSVDLAFSDDFAIHGGFGREEETVTAPLIFLGHGIIAPEYDHDDYAGVDLSGGVAVVLSGAPPRFETDQRAFHSSDTEKRTTASRHGAVGFVTVLTPVDQERIPWSRVVSRLGSPGMRWVDEAGSPHEGFPDLAGAVTLSPEGAMKLFRLAGRDLDALFERHAAGATGSFPMGIAATIARRSTQERITSPNVVGLLRGSDPTLGGEHIVYTAHLDHLGIRPADGAIYNGAYDNAAGVATILGVAEAVAGMKPPPRRSILFVALTAEEKGLQGSSYFVRHPPVPAGSIVANINIDMPYLGFPIADVEGIGVEHSSLREALREAADRSGLALTLDPRPDLVRFIRSDQFSFVKAGVPGLNLKAGSTSSDTDIDGSAMRAAYLEDHYHQPGDDLDLPYNSAGAERYVRTALLLGLIVAAADERPTWNEGDFFGERFGRP